MSTISNFTSGPLAYGVGPKSAPIQAMHALPIIAQRAPTTTDLRYPIGQQWIDQHGGSLYYLMSVSAGSASWVANALGASLSLTGSLTAATGLTATAGGLTVTAGGATITAGNLSVVAGNISTSAGSITAATTLTATLGAITATNGNLVLNTASNGIKIKEGVNGTLGATTLVLGTKTIADTSVSASSRIFLTRGGLNASTSIGTLQAVPGVNTFTINSLVDATHAVETNDVSDVFYIIVNPA